MVYYYRKYKKRKSIPPPVLLDFPIVTIQLPLFNEIYVVERLISSACAIDYPKEKLEIQILDDSIDETQEVALRLVQKFRMDGYDISYIHREVRSGFKSGALRNGLSQARGEFLAIFDADFTPYPDFLLKTIPYFKNNKIGMVQTRWKHINENYSSLTRVQALGLDGHFVVEQTARNRAGLFINFNGTAGVWRKKTILDAGNWQDDTLTEDLDLSYRAQIRGWQFYYLDDVLSPGELPAEINALKSQQYRWTKGAVETAKKLLMKLWGSPLPFRIKLQGTLHLTNNLVFPFILIIGILNVPLLIIKHAHPAEFRWFFIFMSFFSIAFIGSFLMYYYSQKSVYPDWKRRLLLFPLFMAGSMGFSLNNTQAVIQGLLNKKTEFIRTPKYQITQGSDQWKNKKYRVRLSWITIFEIILSFYCLIGVVIALVNLEFAALPFQFMFFLGFTLVSFLSIRHWFSQTPSTQS
jgi:cellulose synthase/poly-beta-1,6-N-acetylglucosamine synthase-like glycosyltransferase